MLCSEVAHVCTLPTKYKNTSSHFCITRGDNQHDQLAVAYQLILDNRNVSKSSSAAIPVDPSSSPPRSFSMSEVIAQVADTPTIKKQVCSLTYVHTYIRKTKSCCHSVKLSQITLTPQSLALWLYVED